MKNQTYNKELKTLITHFIAAFDDIVIKRFDENGVAQSSINVSYVNAPKARVIYDIINKSKTPPPLPIVSVMVTDINRSAERQSDKHGALLRDLDPTAHTYTSSKRPVPIDVTVSMSVIAKYQEDIDQILSNFIPYADPYIVITWKDPLNGQLIDSQIIWSGSVTFSNPIDLAPNSPYRITADTSFVIKGWFFKGEADKIGKIHRINTSFTNVSDLPCIYDDLLYAHSAENTDYFVVDGAPEILFPYQHCFAMDTEPCSGDERGYQTLCIKGNMFQNVLGVWLSANNDAFGEPQYWDLFSTSSVSADNPGFSGVAVEGFNVSNAVVDAPADGRPNNNTARLYDTICFSLPALTAATTFDVIVATPIGYTTLITDAYKEDDNPYPEDHYLYSSYVQTQFPWVSGLTVAQHVSA